MTQFKKSDVARRYVEKFPDAATKTLAELAYKENPSVWPNLEACRTSVRYIRGAHGKRNREQQKDKSLTREPQQPGDPFGTIPEGLVDVEDWEAVAVGVPCKALVLNDVHVPYHDKPALTLALEERSDIDTVILNGDFLDCFALSRWEPDPRKRDFAGELATARVVLKAIRDYIPDAKIVLKIGNHEERYERYMQCKAPELLGVADFELRNLLKCEDYGVEVVGEKRPIRLGKLYVIHGHEYRFAISNPVNPARGLFLRARISAACGHFHQSSQHSEKDMEDHVTSCWSFGCLSDLHPLYMPLNKWNHGFAAVDVDADGAFEVSNYRVIDGKVWS